jgi:hypothetical protein
MMAYDAYAMSKGGTTWDGKPMPNYEDIGEDVQTAWVAAVVAGTVAIVTSGMAPGEAVSTIHEAIEQAV